MAVGHGGDVYGRQSQLFRGVLLEDACMIMLFRLDWGPYFSRVSRAGPGGLRPPWLAAGEQDRVVELLKLAGQDASFIQGK